MAATLKARASMQKLTADAEKATTLADVAKRQVRAAKAQLKKARKLAKTAKKAAKRAKKKVEAAKAAEAAAQAATRAPRPTASKSKSKAAAGGKPVKKSFQSAADVAKSVIGRMSAAKSGRPSLEPGSGRDEDAAASRADAVPSISNVDSATQRRGLAGDGVRKQGGYQDHEEQQGEKADHLPQDP